MMYKQIECPSCGNAITAKSIDETQKCKWCRRLFKVKVDGLGRKSKWTVEPIDFSTDRPEYRSINSYRDADIYRVPRR